MRRRVAALTSAVLDGHALRWPVNARVPGACCGMGAGWTGIVPAKARPMATRMVRMVSSSLIDVSQVARRIQPPQIVQLFQPHVPRAVEAAARSAGAHIGLRHLSSCRLCVCVCVCVCVARDQDS